MTRAWLVFVLSVCLMLGGAAPALGTDPLPIPDATAALGDSITRGFHSSCGLLNDCPENSWSTGSTVESHAARLADLGGSTVRGDNLAVTGAKAAGLAAQAAQIAGDVDYVTVLIGANDACTDTVAQMTPVTDFRASVDSALGTVRARAPGAAVYVASIPDLYRLWQVGSVNGSARFAWWLYGICQSMLANPRSTQQADVQRRLAVRQRVIEFNAALAAECAEYPGTCLYDGGAVFGYPFELSHLSTIDYFHPNVSGQQVLASVTWQAGYTWSSGEPPPNQSPLADAGPDQTVIAEADGSALVTLDGSRSTDLDGDPLTFTWRWGQSGSAEGSKPEISLAVGSHTIALTVEDGKGGTATDSVLITVDPHVAPPVIEIHVGDIDGSSRAATRGRWDADVIITVHDGSESAVSGATVDGSWSGGARGGGSCTTDASGTCAITKSGIKGNQLSVTFSVSGLSWTGGDYAAGENHDPDGDSSGTFITILAP